MDCTEKVVLQDLLVTIASSMLKVEIEVNCPSPLFLCLIWNSHFLHSDVILQLDSAKNFLCQICILLHIRYVKIEFEYEKFQALMEMKKKKQ